MSAYTFNQPAGNTVLAEQQTAAQAATRQAQQAVQLTDYTYTYETSGVGVVEFTVKFDVSFTQEPVMHHGMALPDFETQAKQLTLVVGGVNTETGTTPVAGVDPTTYPLVSAYVKRWLTDSGGFYVGAEMILVIGVLSLPTAATPEDPGTAS